MTVVHLGEIRDLLEKWEAVRDSIRRGETKGFALTVMNRDGQETVFLGGDYERDREVALQAALRMSFVINKVATRH